MRTLDLGRVEADLMRGPLTISIDGNVIYINGKRFVNALASERTLRPTRLGFFMGENLNAIRFSGEGFVDSGGAGHSPTNEGFWMREGDLRWEPLGMTVSSSGPVVYDTIEEALDAEILQLWEMLDTQLRDRMKRLVVGDFLDGDSRAAASRSAYARHHVISAFTRCRMLGVNIVSRANLPDPVGHARVSGEGIGVNEDVPLETDPRLALVTRISSAAPGADAVISGTLIRDGQNNLELMVEILDLHEGREMGFSARVRKQSISH